MVLIGAILAQGARKMGKLDGVDGAAVGGGEKECAAAGTRYAVLPSHGKTREIRFCSLCRDIFYSLVIKQLRDGSATW
jgi:hypothetical protein